MWLEPEDMSEWAYKYCRHIEDILKIRKNITISYWAYRYCRDIKDIPEIRKRITNFEGSYYYCRYVKDRPEVKKNITGTYYLLYLEMIKHRRNKNAK